MKLKILLAALFVAGLGASLALAAPRSDGAGTTTGGTTTAATTGTTTTPAGRKGRDGHDAPPKREGVHRGVGATGCRNVLLRGTVPSSSLALTVTGPGRQTRRLVSGTVNVSVGGNVAAMVRVCGAAGSQTYQLVMLQAAPRPQGGGGTTTTTGTTATTTTATATSR